MSKSMIKVTQIRSIHGRLKKHQALARRRVQQQQQQLLTQRSTGGSQRQALSTATSGRGQLPKRRTLPARKRFQPVTVATHAEDS